MLRSTLAVACSEAGSSAIIIIEETLFLFVLYQECSDSVDILSQCLHSVNPRGLNVFPTSMATFSEAVQSILQKPNSQIGLFRNIMHKIQIFEVIVL